MNKHILIYPIQFKICFIKFMTTYTEIIIETINCKKHKFAHTYSHSYISTQIKINNKTRDPSHKNMNIFIKKLKKNKISNYYNVLF